MILYPSEEISKDKLLKEALSSLSTLSLGDGIGRMNAFGLNVLVGDLVGH